MSHQTVIVLDFGGQYNQLIARRVRECGVYCEVKPYTTPLEQLRAMEPIGFIFTGGPNSVYEAARPRLIRPSLSWVCRCWASAMAASSWPTPWAAR